MARSCTVCRHPERQAIDQALVSGEAVTSVPARYCTKSGRALGRMAVQRHQDAHLPAVLVKAAEQEDMAHALEVVKQLKAINTAALAVLADARAAVAQRLLATEARP